jgi:hypothetical protein
VAPVDVADPPRREVGGDIGGRPPGGGKRHEAAP